MNPLRILAVSLLLLATSLQGCTVALWRWADHGLGEPVACEPGAYYEADGDGDPDRPLRITAAVLLTPFSATLDLAYALAPIAPYVAACLCHCGH